MTNSKISGLRRAIWLLERAGKVGKTLILTEADHREILALVRAALPGGSDG